jgi:hypothetical protein
MTDDPIMRMFGDLPDYPGKTPPKNRKGSKPRLAEDRYRGAKSKVYSINGVDRVLFTVGEFARALGRKAVTIRMWEQQGWIPKANYRTSVPKSPTIVGKPPKGRRLYSLEQLDCVLTGAERYQIDDPVKANWEGFRKHIKDNWPNT